MNKAAGAISGGLAFGSTLVLVLIVLILVVVLVLVILILVLIVVLVPVLIIILVVVHGRETSFPKTVRTYSVPGICCLYI